MMAAPPKPMAGDEICPICNKPKSQHSPKEMLDCSHEMMERDNMRYCSTCGLTKPQQGTHDRCSKCGEKYTFVNQ